MHNRTDQQELTVQRQKQQWRKENQLKEDAARREKRLKEMFKKQHDEQQRQMREMQKRHEQQQAEQRRQMNEMRQRQKQQMKQSYIQQQSTLQSQIDDKTNEYNQIHRELLDLDEKISDEEKSLVNFDDEKNDPNAKIIILLGNTGDGKSTFGNRLCGDTSMMANQGPFRTSSDYNSCTQNLSKHKTEINGKKITVVDAPGFNDTEGRDRFVLSYF